MNKQTQEALKNHAEKYGLTLDQFRMMCKGASETYEGQGMISTDYALAREAYFAGFTKACKEALEQPAQEPVAWMNDIAYSDEIDNLPANRGEIIPLYAHPAPLWQGLSDDEIDKIYFKMFYYWSSEVDVDFARAIEQALKEKNA